MLLIIASFPEQLCIIIDFSSFPEHNIATPYHVVNFTFIEADLDGTTFAYDCRMRFLERALLASCKKSHTTRVTQHCPYLRLS